MNTLPGNRFSSPCPVACVFGMGTYNVAIRPLCPQPVAVAIGVTGQFTQL